VVYGWGSGFRSEGWGVGFRVLGAQGVGKPPTCFAAPQRLPKPAPFRVIMMHPLVRSFAPTPPQQGLEQHPYNLKQFVDKWTDLWKMVVCLPNFQHDIANRVFVDVMNEPDSMGIRWEASGDRPGAQQLYLGTADAIWAITPNKVMFMFEGARARRAASPALRGAGRGSHGAEPAAAAKPGKAGGRAAGGCKAPPSQEHHTGKHNTHKPTSTRPRHGPERLWPQLGQRVHHRPGDHPQPRAVGRDAVLPGAAGQALRRQGALLMRVCAFLCVRVSAVCVCACVCVCV
jgi:hypothetical protein